ncbi:MAG: PDZ domain-containing protein [bacterium]|nr:PDZ domain-containing protein [bacterium]
MKFDKKTGIILLAAVCLFSGDILHAGRRAKRDSSSRIRKATVKILTSYVKPDHCNPWKMKPNRSRVGSGAIIRGNMILTNAHVVADATFVQVQKENDPKLYNARVAHISHEADLALVVLKEKGFFRNTARLKIGGLPKLRSRAATYGYPVGGERISITEGVVSRIEIGRYAHDGKSRFLIIQTDAAINPGNSGGPVIQRGKIAGVAFQRRTRTSGIGYMIPTPVVKHFLKDIRDGRYHGFPSLGIKKHSLQNPEYRAYLGMGKKRTGVIVTHVIPGGSAEKYLKKGDVITHIENIPVANDWSISFAGGRVGATHLIYTKQVGERIKLRILRNGKKRRLKFPLKLFPVRIARNNEYEKKSRYLIFGGILFQPLSKEYIKCWGTWGANVDNDILYAYHYHLSDELDPHRKEFIIINRILPDAANTYISEMHDKLVTEINGKQIRSLADVAAAVKTPQGAYHVIRIKGTNKPLILKASEIAGADKRILRNYKIPAGRR